ncbi:hypothetical protein OG21DRAFT_565920 [Imleria badia]|nr:hypothetical protein OG21DRAFT_565920 [Imleria badia]
MCLLPTCRSWSVVVVIILTSPRQMTVTPQQSFVQDGYFPWFCEGSQWTAYAVGHSCMATVSSSHCGCPSCVPTCDIFYAITVVVVPPGIWTFPLRRCWCGEQASHVKPFDNTD